jgi:hypothetical protein
MKSSKTIAAMVLVFVLSFFTFLYLSFPYGVLKESISSQVQVATGVTMRMDSFGPAFPIGFSAKNVEIYKGQSTRIKLSEVSVKLSILQLLMLNLAIYVDAEHPSGGSLDVGIGFKVFDVLRGRLSMPSFVSMVADRFQLDSLAAFGIQTAVASGVGGPVAGQLLEKLGIKGKLNGEVDLELDSSNISQSNGEMKISFTDAVLVLSDPALNFPDQAFQTAQLSAKLTGGTLDIHPTTRFTTEGLDLGIDGKVVLKAQTAQSDLRLKAFARLKGLLGEQYGALVDAFSGGLAKNGALDVQISGSIGAPEFKPNQ